MGYSLNILVDTGGFPFYLFKSLIEKYEVPYFIETGTASGDTARTAATTFKNVWTIEVIEGRAETNQAPENVTFLQGDSTEHLPAIIKSLNKEYAIFYLDAHYSGDTPNETGHHECPILQEINIIAQYGEKAIIVIDDARLFMGHPPYPHDPTQWPSLIDVMLRLKKFFPYHHITVTDDYILCVPLHVRDMVDEEWRDNFHVRYPSEADKLKQQVKDVYKALIKYIE